MVNTLLSQWRDYMESPQYKQERDRARLDRNEEDKQSEVNAKVKLYRLKHQRRRCIMLNRKLIEGTMREVPYSEQHLYARWENGRLGKEIDEATNTHGYGTLSTGEQIGARGPRFG